ncbi:MAG: zinc ribbon domain-containing protein [Actinobacteria bacterium]|nr:zinc ribbon domain-containing protein [Actinomycetota bacterium]
MPTYEYRCLSCDHQFERFQRMSDEPVKECEVCGEPVRRLLFPVAIQFKGSGFYTTDYARRSTISSGVAHPAGGGDSESGGSDGVDSSDSGDSTASAKSPATKTSEPIGANPGPKD